MQPSKSHAAATQRNKAKATKIPVYLNLPISCATRASATPRPLRREVAAGGERASPLSQRQRGSLMMATKSSSAKMVPKMLKESLSTPPRSAKPDISGTPKHAGKQAHEYARPRSPSPSDTIPVMERSGTFLKDEPTFGDNTTNIDIDK